MNVLIVDDDAAFILPLYSSLPVTIYWAATRPEMEHELATKEFDAIMMDGSLGWRDRLSGKRIDGRDVVHELRDSGVTTKIVMFSSSDKMNEEGISAGANSIWNKNRREEPDWIETILVALE